MTSYSKEDRQERVLLLMSHAVQMLLKERGHVTPAKSLHESTVDLFRVEENAGEITGWANIYRPGTKGACAIVFETRVEAEAVGNEDIIARVPVTFGYQP